MLSTSEAGTRIRRPTGASKVAAAADSLAMSRLLDVAALPTAALDQMAAVDTVYLVANGVAVMFTRITAVTDVAGDPTARRIEVTVARPTLPKPARASRVVRAR